MASDIPDKLFVLEMANNHMGDIRHGLEIIRQFGRICRNYPQFNFAFKLQYRDLDTFIHPAARNRDDVPYVKRFSETRLSKSDFDVLIAAMRQNGFLVMCTPFDENSVDLIESQGMDFIKIASCSFGDWPLLERIVQSNKPIIASTAGANVETIDRVVSFFSHRNKDFAILHCVGAYPTPDAEIHLSQIDFLKARYPNVRIGFSTHESPENTEIIKMAIAKGACIFEKHVGVPTEAYSLNAYSATPTQVKAWLDAAQYAYTVCGVGNSRLPVNAAENASLRSLRRGMFAKRKILAGETIRSADVYFAFPPSADQCTANDFSKYTQFIASSDIPADHAVGPNNCIRKDMHERVWTIAKRVHRFLKAHNISVPGGIDLEISHHYGIEQFDEFGLTMLTIVNRGYCKKLLVVLPGQRHPEQYHLKKEETFQLLAGDVRLELDGRFHHLLPGDIMTVEPGVRHSFMSEKGAIIEEISSTHFQDDSFYTDSTIHQNRNRKTLLTYWMV
jgi:sialic acid synthase SpsE/mannose-6-phosphate isomerase-like protein (cupin superfamily)